MKLWEGTWEELGGYNEAAPILMARSRKSGAGGRTWEGHGKDIGRTWEACSTKGTREKRELRADITSLMPDCFNRRERQRMINNTERSPS